MTNTTEAAHNLIALLKFSAMNTMNRDINRAEARKAIEWITAALAREAALRMLANELSWASKTRDISNRILAVLEVKK